MKKLNYLLFVVMFVPSVICAQNFNSIDAYYGIKSSVSFGYTHYLKYDKSHNQLTGFEGVIGYDFSQKTGKYAIGFSGVQMSRVNHIFKMGVLLYALNEKKSLYYDVYIGYGIGRKNKHILVKINLFNTLTNRLKSEWLEIGFGYSF